MRALSDMDEADRQAEALAKEAASAYSQDTLGDSWSWGAQGASGQSTRGR
jgi:hypothetical protein